MSIFTPTEVGAEFMQSDKFCRLLMGAVGSGKSVTCVHELVRLACGQAPNASGVRRTRALIVRNTNQQLMDTTYKTVTDWLPVGVAGEWLATRKTFIVRANLSDGTRVESEWQFLPMDTKEDVARALSLEATFLFGNECRELAPEVVDGLLGRLNRYPSAKDGGATRACAIFDTNFPDEDTWWWDKAENPPQNWSVHIQPPAIISRDDYIAKYGDTETLVELQNGGPLVIDPDQPLLDNQQKEWLINPKADNLRYLAKDYYQQLIPGKSQDWLSVYLACKYGRSLSGVPVYDKSFVYDFHVSKEPLRHSRSSEYPIVIGQDFGRTPAAVFLQRDVRGRVLVLGELTSEGMGIDTFIKQKLNPYIARRFPGCTFLVAPDPAGFAKQQLNEFTLVDSLKQAGFKCIRPSTNDPDYRISAVEQLLNQHADGKAMLLIDEKECPVLIRGFKHGYRYKIKKTTGDVDDKIDKNNPHTHPHDALQYGCLVINLGSYGWGKSSKRDIKPVKFVYA